MNSCPCNYFHVWPASVRNAVETQRGSQRERLVSTSKRQENVIIQRVQQTELWDWLLNWSRASSQHVWQQLLVLFCGLWLEIRVCECEIHRKHVTNTYSKHTFSHLLHTLTFLHQTSYKTWIIAELGPKKISHHFTVCLCVCVTACDCVNSCLYSWCITVYSCWPLPSLPSSSCVWSSSWRHTCASWPRSSVPNRFVLPPNRNVNKHLLGP